MAKQRIPSDAKSAVGAAIAVTVLGCLIGDMTLGALLVVIVYGLIAFAMWRMPMRESMLGLIFLALTLQDPSDGCPVKEFSPPLAAAGMALFAHLNAAGRELGWANWAIFSTMDMFLVTLLLIGQYRANNGIKMDAIDRVNVPQPLIKLTQLALVGTAFTWMVGLATGGDFGKSLWQLNRVMYLPLIFVLSNMAFRGVQDLEALLKVVLYAAGYKALMALYVVWTVVLPPDLMTGSTRPQWAISHQDSILFATAFVTVFALLLEKVGGLKKALRLTLFMIPLLGGGMWANNRRTAWVQVALVFITVFLLAKDNPVKRMITKLVMISIPIGLVYIAIGWNGGGPLFKPVHLLKSVVDAKSDGSSNWRELENFDLRQTLKANPLFGTGYGHGYYEIIKLPEVNYDLEVYCPHNSLLGVWAYSGVAGFTMLTLLWVASVYFAVRSYHASNIPSVRAGSLAIIGAVVVYIVQCWGDLGLGTWIGVFIIGPSFAMAGKLAVATNQWRAQRAQKSVPAGSFAKQQQPQ